VSCTSLATAQMHLGKTLLWRPCHLRKSTCVGPAAADVCVVPSLLSGGFLPPSVSSGLLRPPPPCQAACCPTACSTKGAQSQTRQDSVCHPVRLVFFCQNHWDSETSESSTPAHAYCQAKALGTGSMSGPFLLFCSWTGACFTFLHNL